MFWIAGTAVLTGLLLTGFGWRSGHRLTLARWCGVASGLFLLTVPVGLFFFLVSGSVFNAVVTDLDLASLSVFGPTFLAAALGLSAAVLSRDRRWWAGLGVIALLLTLAGLQLLNIL